MNKKVFEKFPVLETERLLLRQMAEKDAPQVFEFNSNLETLRYVPRDPFKKIEQGIHKTKSFIDGFENQTALWWTFVLKANIQEDKLIGYGGLFDVNSDDNKAEIGYGLLKPYWRKGMVSEAIRRIVAFGINEMDLHRIYAYIDPENAASIKALEKLAFQREGVLRDDAFAREKYFDMCVYSIIKK